MEHIAFQEAAVGELVRQFKSLWRSDWHQIPITLKAPTGSGKTYIMERFICDLSKQPDWQQDVAFVWITFSDELAMQSRDKFIDYFPTSLPGRLLTIADLGQGVLRSRDVIFLNWQKLVAKRAEGRVNRRPDDERSRKESGYYFEDVVERTHAEGREIVLIIDESHRNVTAASMRDVILPLNPKVILNVSATPESEPTASDVRNGRAGFVEVMREDVVAAGMIKEQIVCQTEEDLRRFAGEDLDKALMQLAMERRRQLVDEITKFGLPVNPLVIVQLPNDDSDSVDAGDQTKEQYVAEYLTAHGVPDGRIARWFDGKKKPAGLERNDSPYDYLLFKMAAGTGWDCPRAQVLVMFREIHSDVFQTQTIGRIVRIPIRGGQGAQVFRTGYIYTNHSRNAVVTARYGDGANRPKVNIAESREARDMELDHKLLTEYIPRADYGDLGKSWEFQKCLVETFNGWFGITDEDNPADVREKLLAKGLLLDIRLTQSVLVNAVVRNADQLGLDLMNGRDATHDVSQGDVQKLFTLMCVQLLREQTDDDCRVGNVARSWGALKSALRLWFRTYAFPPEPDDGRYRIFLFDLQRADGGIFRRLVTATLKAYHPQLAGQIEARRAQALQQAAVPFVVARTVAYSEDYEAVEAQRCLFRPFYLRRDYSGRKGELLFAHYLDSQRSVVWWFKNGDSGKDWYALRYHNDETGETSLFYPDWIFRLQDGTIGIFDTKSGRTATSVETKCKAEALARRLAMLNGLHRTYIRYVGGIAIHDNGQWYYNDARTYQYQIGKPGEGWKVMNDLFACPKG